MLNTLFKLLYFKIDLRMRRHVVDKQFRFPVHGIFGGAVKGFFIAAYRESGDIPVELVTAYQVTVPCKLKDFYRR